MAYHRMVAAVVLALILPVSGAFGGFIEQTIRVDLPEPASGHTPPPWAGPPDFVFNLIPEQAVNGLLRLNELFGGPERLAHVISGVTNTDPIMNIDKTINNDSGFTWQSFLLTLPDEGDITFIGTPINDTMSLISQNDYAVVFGAPDALAHGETMALSFDVLVPSTGPFSFTLTQTPFDVLVPEPTTAVLLSIGLVCLIPLLRRR